MKENIKITNDIINAVYQDIMRIYKINEQEVYGYITHNANLNHQSREEYILTYYENIILKPNAISNDIVDKVFKYIAIKTNLNNNEIDKLIKDKAIKANKSIDEYVLDYYNNVILKDNKDNSVNIEDVDKVNFEELTETDKKVIASRKYMCHEYVKELIRYINKLINVELSNDRRAVDETAVIMYAIQAINRDVVNAVGDTQRILELIKQKQS